MSIENCSCSGNSLDRFYSLFTCDHTNCKECHWTNNKCCNGCYSDTSSSKNTCLNYYDITLQEVIASKIKSFGYCDNYKALAVQFIDGTKKLYLNVEKQIYDDLVALNKDTLFMYLENNINPDTNTCINIP